MSTPALADRFRTAILARLEERGIAQAELARMMGLPTRQQVNNMLNGTHEPRLSTIARACEVLDIDITISTE